MGPISYYNKQGFLSGFLPSKFLKPLTDFNEFGLKFVPLEVLHRTLARTPAGPRAISLVQNVQDGSGATQPPSQWVPGFFPWGQSNRRVKLTTEVKNEHEQTYTSVPPRLLDVDNCSLILALFRVCRCKPDKVMSMFAHG